MTTTTTFDLPFQNKVVTMALRDKPFMQRVEGLLKPEYFDQETHRFLADFINEHYETYRETPSSAIIIHTVKTRRDAGLLKPEFVDELKESLKTIYSPTADLSNREWTVDQVSKFARHRAIEDAIGKSLDVLEAKGDVGEIEGFVREAIAVGAHEGTSSVDYQANVEARIKARVDRLTKGVVRGIPTGYRELDDLLYHKGWGRKEFSLLMGGAKAGKSTGLGQFAVNAAGLGYNVLYTTHENSAEVTQDRLDACVAGVTMKELDTSAATVKTAVINHFTKGGVLKIEEFPSGTATVADIRRVIRKYAAQGIKFDLLVCDYADELAPPRRVQEERHGLKLIYQGLRALAMEEDMAVLSATQTTRAGNKATTVTKTDVAEDFNKIRIADTVISINATDEERKMNQIRLFFAAMRNNEDGITVHCLCDRSRMRFITKVIKVA